MKQIIKFQMSKNQGQVVLILILIVTVALAVGLSVIQKSLVDVSTSTKVEQSQRAFSAAEAGIEQALRGAGNPNVTFPENNSEAQVTDSGLRPAKATPGNLQEPLEFDPFSKEDVIQVWLADYTSSNNPPPTAYADSALDVYWGNSTQDKAALELTLVQFNGTQYKTFKKWTLDHPFVRTPANNFEQVTCSGYPLGSKTYQCKRRIGVAPDPASLPSSGMMLLRARLLYNTQDQPFAVQAVNTCGSACSIPPQQRILISTGTSGNTRRRVKVTQSFNEVPFWFDYAIFASGEIKK